MICLMAAARSDSGSTVRWPPPTSQRRMVTRQSHDMARRNPHDSNLVSASTDQSWRDTAACQQYPPEWWFPADSVGRPVGTRQPGRAEQICADCPVQLQCALEARRTKSSDGIWAGKRRR